MADDVDIASQNEEAFRQHAISLHKERILPLNGRCYYCDEPTKGNFCSVECREDWERIKYFELQKKSYL
ncbi:hypothetical protein [Candidatus Schneideria nysicola]|uniref:hypothetical protein n=1 Tax=Candidatus Schneideria nysicola TaxID=1081631 RepID=UPI001CAA459E|nr:hypothetical protein [Candidatus Schneideria nysicola]UAJ65048.1 hypothetical protein KEC35_00245 [Candidatus Schneideria nysicola]UAJ65581.1 hypothetical protein KEC37_00245 [Candidatus Schneideria nysicola]UAJ66108.1 hypothetical protein KEC38_00245 [Candidatus Schneideria nysicola]